MSTLFLSIPFPARRIRAAAFVALGLLAVSAGAQQQQQQKTQPQKQTQGAAYRAVPAVSADQAQVIFFRPASTSASGNRPGAAHVYIDGEFHAALLPNSFTRLCVRPGNHSVEAYIGDAPTYEGKSNPRTHAELEGGKTVFVAVSEQDGSGAPVPYRRADAERMLSGAHEQRHVISRAIAVQPCRDVVAEAPPVEKARYTLNTDTLFAFGRSDLAAMTAKGRTALAEVATQIRANSLDGVTRIAVRGHADPIGSAPENLRLSELRAQTVSRVLADEGLPADRMAAEGMGSTETVVSCAASRSRDARIACNAPNRRVEVVVQGVK